MLQFRDHDETSWMPAVIKTSANENKGIDEVALEIERHKEYLVSTGKLMLRRKEREKNRLEEIVESEILGELWSSGGTQFLHDSIQGVLEKQISPYTLSKKIIEKYKEFLKERQQ